MVFVKTWDESVPAGSEAILTGDDRIREFKTGIRERLAVDHNFKAIEGADTLIGAHNQVSFIDQVSDIAAKAGATCVYGKTVAGKIELFLILSDSTIVQLTSNGKINAAAISGIIPAANLGSGTPDATTFLRGDGAWANNAGGVLGAAKKLQITRPTATTVTITADELILEDSSNNKVTVRSVSRTPAITSSGANGLDTGAEASGTWYYIWIIRKSSDGTTDSLLSASSTAPTLPAGYDQKALVGAVRNDGSSNFVDFIQNGRNVSYMPAQAAASGTPGLLSWTTLDISAYVPSALSKRVKGSIGAQVGANCCATNDSAQAVDNGTNYEVLTATSNSGATQFDFQILTADTIYWAGGSNSATVWIAGYIIDQLN